MLKIFVNKNEFISSYARYNEGFVLKERTPLSRFGKKLFIFSLIRKLLGSYLFLFVYYWQALAQSQSLNEM